jgi:hypothetical protein
MYKVADDADSGEGGDQTFLSDDARSSHLIGAQANTHTPNWRLAYDTCPLLACIFDEMHIHITATITFIHACLLGKCLMKFDRVHVMRSSG